MKKYQGISMVLVFIALTSAAIAWSDNEKDNEGLLLAKAKLSLAQAVDKALAEVPGHALSAELNNEKHDQLVFIVEVVQAEQTYEVTVDALTGKVRGKVADQLDDEDNDREDRD